MKKVYYILIAVLLVSCIKEDFHFERTNPFDPQYRGDSYIFLVKNYVDDAHRIYFEIDDSNFPNHIIFDYHLVMFDEEMEEIIDDESEEEGDYFVFTDRDYEAGKEYCVNLAIRVDHSISYPQPICIKTPE